jgi:hypothetical protein
LEANFSHFAKIRWMSSLFAKLLELLLEIFIAAGGGKWRLIPVEGINRYKIE